MKWKRVGEEMKRAGRKELAAGKHRWCSPLGTTLALEWKTHPFRGKKEKKVGKTVFFLLLSGLFAAGYGRLFFSVGVEFGDSFLEKQEEPSQEGVVYQEFFQGASVEVQGEGSDSAEIVCSLPDGGEEAYTVRTEKKDGRISAVILGKGKKEICRGTLVEETFLDVNGNVCDQPVSEQINSRYEHSPEQLVSIAQGRLRLRGRWGFFLAGFLLFVLLSVDMRFSVSYFALVNLGGWKRPVPCEFCSVLQAGLRYLMVLLGAWMLIWAVVY